MEQPKQRPRTRTDDTFVVDGAYLKREFGRAIHNYMAPLTWIYKNITGNRCSLFSCYDYKP